MSLKRKILNRLKGKILLKIKLERQEKINILSNRAKEIIEEYGRSLVREEDKTLYEKLESDLFRKVYICLGGCRREFRDESDDDNFLPEYAISQVPIICSIPCFLIKDGKVFIEEEKMPDKYLDELKEITKSILRKQSEGFRTSILFDRLINVQTPLPWLKENFPEFYQEYLNEARAISK